MQRVDKKLREAHFFLGKMVKRATMAFGDHEEFDFFLSGFLSAARSVDYRLRHVSPAYSQFRVAWDGLLSTEDTTLIKAMVDDRNVEVHEAGSSRGETEVRVPAWSSYEDASGIVTVSAPPGTLPAEIIKPTYFFIIDGRQTPVLDACRHYLGLLERLVREFRHSQGIV